MSILSFSTRIIGDYYLESNNNGISHILYYDSDSSRSISLESLIEDVQEVQYSRSFITIKQAEKDNYYIIPIDKDEKPYNYLEPLVFKEYQKQIAEYHLHLVTLDDSITNSYYSYLKLFYLIASYQLEQKTTNYQINKKWDIIKDQGFDLTFKKMWQRYRKQNTT